MTIEYFAPYVLEKANPLDAGWDIKAVEEVVFAPGDRRLVRTGLYLGRALRGSGSPICEARGYHVDIRGRSSMWRRGFNTFAGLVDENYHSEILVGLEFTGLAYDDYTCYTISPGDKIAQLVFLSHYSTRDLRLLDAPPDPKRGGFGSSGR